MSKLPEIAKCACGHGAYMGRTLRTPYGTEAHVEDYFVGCWGCGALGLVRRTERGAINAWNKVMEAGK